MKKKLKFLIGILIVLQCFIMPVSAVNDPLAPVDPFIYVVPSVNVSSDDVVVAGDEIIFDVQVSTTSTHAEFRIEYDPNLLEFVSVETPDYWHFAVSEDHTQYTIDSEASDSRLYDTMKIHFRTKAEGVGQWVDVTFTDIKSGDGQTDLDSTHSFRIASNNNQLSDLFLSEGTMDPSFSSHVYEYTAYVPMHVTEVMVYGMLADATNAIFVDGYGVDRAVSLTDESNDIEVKVRAQDGSESTYTIHVVRVEDVTSHTENRLQMLIANLGHFTFDPDQNNYVLEVPYEVNRFEVVSYELMDPVATVTIPEGIDLQVGANQYSLSVFAGDGTENIYTFDITRLEEGSVTLDSNNYLQSLTIGGYDLSFDKDQLVYTLHTTDFSQLLIDVVPESNKAQIQIIGNQELHDGSIVRIVVTAENGENRIYEIHLTAEKEDHTLLIVGIVTGSIVLLGLIGTGIYFYRKKSLQKKKEII